MLKATVIVLTSFLLMQNGFADKCFNVDKLDSGSLKRDVICCESSSNSIVTVKWATCIIANTCTAQGSVGPYIDWDCSQHV